MGDALAQHLDLVVLVGLAELAPDRLHLLTQQELALTARHLLLHHGRDLLLDLVDLRLPTDEIADAAQALTHLEQLEDLLLGRRPDREVRADEVGERPRILHVVEHRAGLARLVREHLEQAAGGLAQVGRERVDLDVAHRRLVDALDRRRHVRVAAVRLEHAHPADPLEHHGVVAAAEADDLEHPGERAQVIDLVERGVLGLGDALRDHADRGPVATEGVLDQLDRASPADVDGHHGGGEEHGVPERQQSHPPRFDHGRDVSHGRSTSHRGEVGNGSRISPRRLGSAGPAPGAFLVATGRAS